MTNRTSHLLVVVLCFAIVRFPSDVVACAQPKPPERSSGATYRTAVSEVRLVFFATDASNHPVNDLQANDFAVIDNERVIRDFRSFTQAELIKLDLIVLVDTSESVMPRFQQEIPDALRLISRWQSSPDDHISVISFSGTGIQVVCERTCGSEVTAATMASLPSSGATPLFDAVSIAAGSLVRRKRQDVWPVIILFSDGEDTISRTSLGDAREQILASGAQVYAIDVSRSGTRSNGSATLQRMAEDSGGRYVPLSAGTIQVFQDVIDDLHSARVVTYALPESNSAFHSVRILPAHNLNLQFRSRRGYYQRLGDSPEAP